MKMLVFSLLAKARHVIQSIKDLTWRRSGMRSINCLDSGYNLDRVYTPAQSAVQIWTADLRIQKKKAYRNDIPLSNLVT
jgi:hypothetical protein